MVKVIKTSGIRMDVHEDLYDRSVDGIDYSQCPPEYDYEQDLPESALVHGKRVILYNDETSYEIPPETKQLFFGNSILEEEE